MQVEIAGYRRAAQQNIDLTGSAPVVTNITLEGGNRDSVVEITGTAPLIQTDEAQQSTGLGTRQVREHPVIDRNYQELVGLQSGITPPQPALDLVRDPDRNRFYSANGQAPTTNEYRRDGVTNMEPFRGTAVRVQPVENVQELVIETSNLRPNKGFAAGALVTDITRAGTNDWHGGLYEFYSGNILRSRNVFNTANNPTPRFVHNQLGGNFGGAIVRDRTFFFGSYDGNFDNGSMTQLSTVPTAQALTGNLSGIPGLTIYNPNTGTNGVGRTAFAGGIIPVAQINRTAAAIAGLFPAANQPGFVNNLVSNVPFRNHDNRFDGRLDQHISDRTHAFLRFGWTNASAYEASPYGDVIGSATRSRLLGYNAVADITHEFTPALITDFRVGYNRYDQKLNAWGDQSALAGALGNSNLNNNLIGINISGFGPIGSSAYVPQRGVDNNFNFVWDWALHKGMHNVRFGVDMRRFRVDGFSDTMFGSTFGPNGTAYFGTGATMSANGPALSQYGALYNSWAAFLLGAPSQVGISTNFVTPTIRQSQYAGWAGDTIQLMGRLTLDLGVRYDVYSPLEPRHAGGAQYFNASNNTFNYAGIGDTAMQLANYDTNNIAPRIGLAFRVSQKTAVRAGYGITYFQQPYMLSGFVAPAYGSVTGVQGGFTTATIPGGFAPVFAGPAAPASLQNGAAAGNQTATVLPTQNNTPYVQNFNFQIQQEFAGTVLSVGYVGALDRKLPFVQELNAAFPGTGTAGLPFGTIGRTGSTLGFDSGLTSNYNSLQVNLNRRFSHGLSFTSSYTFSKALGYTSSNGMLLNSFNRQSNYGPLDFDRQHVLTIGHLWELPFGRNGSNMLSTILGGWQLNGLFTWDSGTPLTITTDPVSCACPGNTVLANLNGSPFSNNGTAYLNPAAFSAPAFGQFGNLGRAGVRGPGSRNYNVSLFKHFRVRDRFDMELRGEAYNLTNTPHFSSPVTNISSPNFGQTVSTLQGGSFGRQVNLALRLGF